MSELMTRAQGQVYMVHRDTHDCPFAYATLTDFKPGQGLLQIHSDWGTYSAFWGAMGKDRKIKEFILDANESYIENNLAQTARQMGMKQVCFIRLTKLMSQCWPRLRDEFKLGAPDA